MKKLIFLIILFTFSACELELEHANPLDNLELTTGSAQEISTSSCKIQGTITTNELNGVDDYGHCWSLQNNPTVSDPSTSFGDFKGKKTFVSDINNLAVNTSYYIRAYAKANDTILYAESISIETEWALDVPLIETGGVNLITTSSATVQGEIIEQGMSAVTKYGHCWSISTSPTISDNILEYIGGSTTDIFSTSLTDLSSNTIYYYRAYAQNSQGLAYGSEQSFSTTNGEPTVITGAISNISSTSIILEGEIIGIGDASVTQHGHCWSTSSSPTINDDNTTLESGSVGVFTSNVSNLTQNTSYYYRAYATNSFGTVYGSALSFSTSNGEPTIVTVGSNSITASTVNIEGDITGIGDASVTQHGHCWSTSSSPTTNDDNTILGSGSVGAFTSNVSNLTQNTYYYYRAYATNSFGTVYGSSMNFTTINGGPNVITSGSTNITDFSAELVGSINAMGGAPVTEHGHCFSITNQNPTTSGSRTTLGAASLGSFNSLVGSLSGSTTYYYRAYATNSFGTVYGSTMNFSTLPTPPPNGPCNITGINSSNTPYDLTLIPSSNTFNFGDNITINMYHPFYSAGQSSILLYENETLILNLCSFCIFTDVGSGNYQRTITLPSSGTISPSNCYTIRVLGTSGGANAYLNISNPVTIY